MGSKHFQDFVAALLFCLLLAARCTYAEVSCSVVHAKLASCKGYVTAKDDTPPTGCCHGLNTLKSMAASVEDRRAICSCLQTLLTPGDEVDDQRVADLPVTCGVTFAISFNRSFDCNSIGTK
ncbi:non-specific lipid-transfer protein B-like [Wolffia australiana]